MEKFIIVTGGAGYIGSHACKILKERGFVPVAVDNLITGWREAVKFGPFEHCDLLDASSLGEVFQKYRPVAVMHFAALSQVGESMLKPEKYWINNVQGSLNLITTAVENECLNFIYSSTCATYGEQDGELLSECSAQKPINAYGASKLAVEHMLQNYKVSGGLRFVIFRYFNVAGADPSALIGEYHRPETHLIPLLLQSCSDANSSFKLYGNDYPTPDGSCVRDYVHVCDLIDAHLSGLDWLLCDKESDVFNLGTGKGFTVKEIISEVKRVVQCEIPIEIHGRRPGDCAQLVSGSAKARNLLGWQPYRSTLNQIINDAWRWYSTGKYTF